LKRNEILELKNYTAPPKEMIQVMEMILTIFGLAPVPSSSHSVWAAARKYLLHQNSLAMFHNFDFKMMGDDIADLYSWVLTDPRFNLKNLNKISRALSSITAWIVSLIRFKKASKQMEQS